MSGNKYFRTIAVALALLAALAVFTACKGRTAELSNEPTPADTADTETSAITPLKTAYETPTAALPQDTAASISSAPTAQPTAAPTQKPTAAQTARPTAAPTAKQTAALTASPAPTATALPAELTYSLLCVDQNNDPVEGVTITLCDDTSCLPLHSGSSGTASYTGRPYAYEAHVVSIPEGYTQSGSDSATFSLAGGRIVFRFTKG